VKQKTFDHPSNLNYPKQLEHSEADIDRLKELYEQGRLKDVISIGENLTERYPNVLAFFEILGAAYLGLGEEEKTIEFYQKTLEINPKHTDAHNNIGIVFYNQNRLKEAVASFQKAVEIEPDFANAHFYLGNAFRRSNKLKKEIEIYKASV
jgi:superkiller protein 3